MYSFNVSKVSDEILRWIRDWFEINGKDCNAVIGVSGGKDSSVVAALLVKALGKERVIGVLMPCGKQSDISFSKDLVKFLDIKSIEFNIKSTVDAFWQEFNLNQEATVQAKNNLQPRIRMSVLYAIAQSNNGRVANTCNLSEDWVGYSTRYGDNAGDFSPISNLTVNEVKQLGTYLGLPDRFIQKPPIDGLCGKTDEDNLGFTYAVLDDYIRKGILPNEKTKERIDELHRLNEFKTKYMDCFAFNPEVDE